MVSNTFKTSRVDTSADDNLNHSRFSKGLSVFLNWLDFESSTALIWENKTTWCSRVHVMFETDIN